MSRLIDADAVKKVTVEINGYSAIYDDVANTPTADIVAVTRCEHCKHYFTGQCCHPSVYYHGAKALMVKPDDYCSKAVREDI